MENVFKFEKLIVWQKSLDYVDLIYKLSSNFPIEERFGLQSQIRRSAVSVALNIAEGSGRTTNKEFSKFLHDSLGSLRESLTCLIIAQRQGFISSINLESGRSCAVEISKMIYALMRKLRTT